MTRRRALWIALSLSLVGCGLTLDYAPPDPQLDAGRMDGGRARDGGGNDASTDGGPARECAEDVECDDGDACNGREQCVGGACVGGEPVACPDDDVCDGVDRCVAGECITGAPPLCASDDDPCNGVERCDPVLGCVSGPAPDCDDGIECTRDSCDPSATPPCVHEPDDSLCTAAPGGRCVVDLGGCQYPTCDSTTCVSTGCQLARCEDGACVYTPLCAASERCCANSCVPAGCDDGNPCTADVCDPAAGCVHAAVPAGTPCDDGNRCTTMDACTSAGVCAGGPPLACGDGNACTVETCDPASGCVSANAPDGTACNDGNACTTSDRCVAGTCVPGPARVCMVAIAERAPCVSVHCDATVGCVEVPLPAGTPCGSSTDPSTGTCDGAGHCCGRWSDCDGDSICECPPSLTCGIAGGCPGHDCTDDADCAGVEACCRAPVSTRRGYCYPRACPGCCITPAAT